MHIPKRYYDHIEINRASFDMDIPSEKKLVSCGLVQKTPDMFTQLDLIVDYYSGVYVLDGTGTYTDKVTNQTYALYPGCFIQRLPGRPFDTHITSGWLEFYLNLNRDLFNTLADLHIFSRDPVLDIGERYYLFDEFLDHMQKYNNFDPHDYPILMFEVCKILHQINAINRKEAEIDIVGICSYLEQHLAVGENLRELVEPLGYRYEQLRKVFKSKCNVSMSSYIIQHRIQNIKELLNDPDLSIQEIADRYNYCDVFALIKQFKKVTGLTPTQYRKSL